mgnify:CR=1 FL=1
MNTHIDPEEVTEVLLRGDHDWLSVASMETGWWRLHDGSQSDRGKRGWIITTTDGERICVGVTGIEGVR